MPRNDSSARSRSERALRRKLDPLSAGRFDVLIIGGGISGACLLWDAALRGLSAALIEKNDYASGTTQATSKLIHGGLRYLKNGEFGLVRESLRERRTLAAIAPHAVRPEAFLVPIYRKRGTPRWMMGLALWLYDRLAWDRNRGLKDGLRLPGSRWLDRDAALAEEPSLDPRGLKGAYLYYDYANLNPERLALEFILSATERGAVARNYLRAGAVTRDESDDFLVAARDELSGESVVIRARTVVNAGGPWADYLEEALTGKVERALVRSKGIHLVTRKIIRDKTVVGIKPDGAHLFLIPWRGRTLIGTTDTEYRDHPDQLTVSAAEAARVLEDVNAMFPDACLSLADVDYFYGGLRPLVEDSGRRSSYNASRKMEIVDHALTGFPGFFTVLGGKYTTSRALAQKAIDRVCLALGRPGLPCRTAETPLLGGEYDSPGALAQALSRAYPETPVRIVGALVARYGAAAERILATGSERSRRNEDCIAVSEEEVFYLDEIRYLVLHEGVEHLGDLLFRRTGIGTTGPLPDTALQRLVEVCGDLLGWSRAQRKAEREAARARYRLA